MKFWYSSFLWAIAVSAPLLKPADAAPDTSNDRIVVMISVDGLAAFYLDDPKAEMPTIRALAADGAHGRMKASAPTVTRPRWSRAIPCSR